MGIEKGRGQMTKRVSWLDNARALSALWIVAFWHLDDYLSIDYCTTMGNYITLGCLATFCYISGHCLGGKCLHNCKDWIIFYKSRFVRIYPLYALSCILLFLLHKFVDINYIHSTYEFIFSLLGIAAIFPPMPSTIWFVNCILVYYFVTPIIIIFKKHSVQLIVSGIVCLFMLFLVILGNADKRLVFYFVFYLMGIFVGNRKKANQRVNIGGMLFALIVLLGMKVIRQFGGEHLAEVVVACVMLIIIIEIGKVCSLDRNVSKVLYYISYSSFCMYLFHREFFGIIFLLFGSISEWVAYFVLLPILIMLSYYIQKGYDRIVDNLKER